MDNKTIYELLKEVREDQKSHVKEGQETRECVVKQSVSITEMQKNISDIKEDVAENKDNLKEHMQRTYQVEIGQEKMFGELERLHNLNFIEIERLNKAHEEGEKERQQLISRVDKLEEPQKAKTWIKKNLYSIISTITAIGSLIGLLTKYLGKW